ncbi:MAG TPA: Ig-like domain-containing protein, partial [Gemmatimonadales bacterium]
NQGTLTVAHPLTLGKASADHLNSGTLELTSGNFTLTQSGTTPTFTTTGTITIGTGRTFTVSGGTFTNDGAGVLQGAGTLNVSGTTFSNNAAINPGTSPGILTITGNAPLGSTSSLNIELGGTTAGTGYDRLAVSGAVTLDGSLVVDTISAFAPAEGNSFAIMTFASRTGTFSSITFPNTPGVNYDTLWVEGGAVDTLVITAALPVASVDVTPTGSSIAVSGTATLSAQPKDSAGGNLTRTVTWTSLNPSIATVNGSGTVTGVAAGQVTLAATAEGVTGYAIVNVTEPSPVLADIWAADAAGSNTLYDAWGSSASNVYATSSSTGTNATGVYLFNGTSWALADATAGGSAIWGLAPDTLYTLAGTTVWSRVGGAWSSATITGRTQPGRGIWASAPNDIIVVGDAGEISRFDGTAWSTTTPAGAGTFRAVWGASSDTVLAVGDNETLVRWDGATWTDASGSLPVVTSDLQTVWGTSGSDVWVGGTNSVILRYNGSTWSSSTIDTASLFITDLWGTDSTDVYAAINSGFEVWHYNGSTWSKLIDNLVGTSNTSGIWTTSTGEVVATGFSGTRVRGYRNTAVTVSPTTATLASIGATTTLTASATSGGSPISNVQFTWTSTNAAVATVDINTGVVTAVSTGTADIVATAAGGLKADTATVTVSIALAEQLAFTSNTTGNNEVFTRSADGLTLTNITNDAGSDSDPDWSRDAARLTFFSPTDGDDEIYVINADGTGRTQLTSNTAGDAWVAWSPDNQRIAFASDRDGDWEIFTMNSDGTGVTQMTSNTSEEKQPTWSADGQFVAYYTARHGVWQIYTVNVTTLVETRITTTSSNEFFPDWSPVGNKIAFVSDRNGNFEIYSMNTDGSSPIRLTTNSVSDLQPTWNNDGTKIAYSSYVDSAQVGGINTLRVMDADGSNDVRVTNIQGQLPSWQPLVATTVTVAPASPATLTSVGDTVHLTADLRDASNNAVLGTAAVWTSSDTGVATVTTRSLIGGLQAAVVTAVGNGSATITATAPGGASGGVTVTVNAGLTANVFQANEVGNDGRWTTAANWSLGRVPNSTDSVLITYDSTFTVTVDGTATAGFITVQGNVESPTLLITTGGTLTVSDGGVIGSSGILTLSAGTLDYGSATISDTGTFNWNGGTLTGGLGALEVTNAGTANIGGTTQKTLSGGELSLRGTTTWSGTGGILLNNAGTLRNYATGTFTITGTGTMSTSGTNGFFYNLGTLTKSSAGTSLISGTGVGGQLFLQNSGTIVLSAGTLDIRSLSHQDGALIRGTATLDLSNATTSSRTFAGDINPGGVGTAGILAILGSITLTSNAELAIDIIGSDNVPGTNVDQLQITGSFTPGGRLNFVVNGSPSTGTQYTIVTTTAGIAGSFGSITPAGWSASPSGNNLIATSP